VQNLSPLEHPVKTIALAPSGGVLADAIGLELFENGFRVVDTQQTSNVLMRLNLDELEIMEPKSMTSLKERGIDAVLLVRSVAGHDNLPQSASVRVLSASSFSLVAGASWQNGRGGAQGSPPSVPIMLRHFPYVKLE
jgi:hypothetical protein